MCDDFIHPGLVTDSRLSRRSFGLMTAASAGIAASPALAQSNVAEKDVTVKTPDGSCDAVLFHPATSSSGLLASVADHTKWPPIGPRSSIVSPGCSWLVRNGDTSPSSKRSTVSSGPGASGGEAIE